MNWAGQMLQDLRYGLRGLRLNRGFCAVVILTLALSIGMNTAVFSIVNAVLLRPLPYPDGDRIVWMVTHSSSAFGDVVAPADFFDLQDRSRSFDKMALYGYQNQTIEHGEATIRASIAPVSDNFWSILGAQPGMGRLFLPSDRNSIVLSHGIYVRHFGSDPAVIGKSLMVDGQPFTVVGVLPEGFHFLLPAKVSFLGGDEGLPNPDAYVTLAPPARVRGTLSPYNIVATLKPGVALQQARSEVEVIEAGLAAESPSPFMNEMKPRVEQLSGILTSKTRRPLFVLAVAVVFVLLVACANIAGLLTAQAAGRRREIAIRASLGAGRWRVIRQFLVESCLLSILGGVAGLFVARTGLVVILRLIPQSIPRLAETTIDTKVLIFAAGISVVTGILFGVGPSLAFSRARLSEVMKEGTFASPGFGAQQMRRLLVATEIALAIVLLTGAGLLIKSFWRMNARAPGFSPESILVMPLDFSGPHYRDLQVRDNFLRELLLRTEAIPGGSASGIAAINTVAFGAPEGQPESRTTVNAVSSAYGSAVGMRILKGRWITEADPRGTAVVNESAARLWFGHDDPMGRRISISPEASVGPIVGVVHDLKYLKRDANPEPEVYIPYARAQFLSSTKLLIRVSGDPSPIGPMLRQIAADIDRSEASGKIQTLEAVLSDSIAPRRFNLFLLGAFASVALLLAIIGIYGVMAYSISQRTREIGVRMALGSQRGKLVAMIVGQGMKVAFFGIAAGLVASLMLSGLMASLLYDVSPNDLPTLAVVSAILGVTALLACWIPALKGAKINPIVALRCE